MPVVVDRFVFLTRLKCVQLMNFFVYRTFLADDVSLQDILFAPVNFAPGTFHPTGISPHFYEQLMQWIWIREERRRITI